ncbi:hypothetical protein DKX38_020774 [Salix brachista]|uniref:Uncharacterized protein n=1 Tax=Salix brachista TaxID=2182728 RepID=A0A5N5KDD5_9ROSI|nr:hypothetical protein DKX38_020774 [Salix brachista]
MACQTDGFVTLAGADCSNIGVFGSQMGLIRSSFSFMFGTLSGIYIAQSYNVPNIKKLAVSGLFMAKQMEETYRKPDKKKDRDNVSE